MGKIMTNKHEPVGELVDEKAFAIMVQRAGIKPESVAVARKFIEEYLAASKPPAYIRDLVDALKVFRRGKLMQCSPKMDVVYIPIEQVRKITLALDALPPGVLNDE